MKTTDPRDPLDRQIDALLASQPLKPSGDFLARTLESIDAVPEPQKASPFAKIIPFALPAAALIAIALVMVSQLRSPAPEIPAQLSQNPAPGEVSSPEPPSSEDASGITRAEIDELFLLQEGLSGLAELETESLRGGDLLNTLDALYSI
jgi:hypothetical protein